MLSCDELNASNARLQELFFDSALFLLEVDGEVLVESRDQLDCLALYMLVTAIKRYVPHGLYAVEL